MTGQCLMGRYLVGEKIGEGGMAVVYKAHDLRTGRAVAIKCLRQEYNQDEEFLLRFEREAQAAALISHENLIDLYDVGMQDNTHFIVMEYVDGLTLKSLIREQGALDNYTAISIARQMCLALKLVHGAKIIHRDIKSQNILLDRKGIAKLADFGIARAADSNTHTISGDKGVLGSVHYFSPEQARGERATQSSDLYSLGVVLFEMITGRVPFDGDTAVSIALHHLHTPVPSVRSINPNATKALDEIIHKAMEKDPAARYQDANAFYNDLCMALVYPEGGFIQITSASEEKFKEAEAREEHEQSQALALDKEKKDEAEGTADHPQRRRRRRIRNLPIVLTTAILLVAGIAVTVVVLFGLGAMPGWTNAPQLVGLQFEDAQRRAAEQGLTLGVNAYAFDDFIPPGTVIDQDPRTGSPIRQTRALRVTLCRGPEFPTMPDLQGLTLEEAQGELLQNGLTLGDVQRREDPEAGMNVVLDQGVAPGTSLNNGDSVSLVVSSTPVLRTVPDLSGRTEEDARLRLEAEGLTLASVMNEHVTGYEVGEVFRQEPEPGASLYEGGEVTIWVNIAVATYHYQSEIEIPEDDTNVRIYVEDEGEMKMIYEELRPKGTFSIDLDLESPTEGFKTILVYFGETESSRESVFFSEDAQ